MQHSTDDSPRPLVDFIAHHCSTKLVNKTPTGTVTLHLAGAYHYLKRSEIYMALPLDFIEHTDWRWGPAHSTWSSSQHRALVFQQGGGIRVEICSSYDLYWYRLRVRQKNKGDYIP